MKFEEVLFSRRSVRRFQDRQVPEELLEKILTAGLYAPSACNFQAWKFIVLTDRAQMEKLRFDLVLRAPCGVLVTYRNDLYVTGRKHRDYVQSAAAAIENMLLEAKNLGLGGCWICNLPRQGALRRAFGIPRNFDVIAYVMLGYPLEEANTDKQMRYHYGSARDAELRTRRYGLAQAVSRERFTQVPGDCAQEKRPWAEKVRFFVKEHFYKGE